MKLIFETTFNSNEYWTGTTYCLIEMSTRDAEYILAMRQSAVEFLGRIQKISGETYGYGHVRYSIPGVGLTFFDDNNDSAIEKILDGNAYEFVDDKWEIPEDCEHARTECHQIQIHSDDGELFIIASSKHSSDYVEVQLPDFHIKAGKIIIESNQPQPATRN